MSRAVNQTHSPREPALQCEPGHETELGAPVLPGTLAGEQRPALWGALFLGRGPPGLRSQESGAWSWGRQHPSLQGQLAASRALVCQGWRKK